MSKIAISFDPKSTVVGAAVGFFGGKQLGHPLIGAAVGMLLANYAQQQIFEAQMGRDSILDHLLPQQPMGGGYDFSPETMKKIQDRAAEAYAS